MDISVLLLFFNRPDAFGQVFAEVRKAKPARLFLYQDGPRGERDIAGIEACRKIAEGIDWPCEVHRLYQERNYGCDPSEELSQRWAFSQTDKCIVLEDDAVPSQSFFPFCKEMLDRYADDDRITMVAGFNTDETTDYCPNSYFFTSVFSIWGWASWARVFRQREEDYGFMRDDYAMRCLRSLHRNRRMRPNMLRMFADHAASGTLYYETIFWAAMLLNNGLAIMPRVNMIRSVGATADSTHFTATAQTMPRQLRRIFTMPAHDLDFPLHHPRYIVEDTDYKERLDRRYAWGHPWIKIGQSLEELWLNLRHGNFAAIAKAMKRRAGKWLGTDKHV